MPPDALQAFFRAGIFITVVALLLVLVTPRENAEFVVSVCSLGVGLALTVLVMAVQRLSR